MVKKWVISNPEAYKMSETGKEEKALTVFLKHHNSE